MLDITYGNIKIFYEEKLDGGGGLKWNSEILDAFKNNIGYCNSVLDICCGPGLIGFNILGHSLCKNLTLSDINLAALELCNKTIKYNNLENNVSTIQSNCFDNIPKSTYDLIISNPPHYYDNSKAPRKENYMFDVDPLIFVDWDWGFHETFYSNVSKYLNKDGHVLMLEAKDALGANKFKSLIDKNNLKLISTFDFYESSNAYFMLITHD